MELMFDSYPNNLGNYMPFINTRISYLTNRPDKGYTIARKSGKNVSVYET